MFDLLQDHSVRVSWKDEVRGELAASCSTACAFRRVLEGFDAIHRQRAARPRVRRAAHARRRRQCAHQHPGQLRRLRHAAGGQSSGGAHHAPGEVAGRRDLRRARHRHHQARVSSTRAKSRRSAAYKEKVDPQGRFNRASCWRAPICATPTRRSFSLLGAESLILEQSRDRQHLRLDQGLPALRQVQAGVRDARAARQPAVQPAQQDPRHLAADRGLSVRGADAARRLACGTSTSSATSPTTARCATSARTPARWTSTSATCRSRCATCCARRARRSSTPARPRRCCS